MHSYIAVLEQSGTQNRVRIAGGDTRSEVVAAATAMFVAVMGEFIDARTDPRGRIPLHRFSPLAKAGWSMGVYDTSSESPTCVLRLGEPEQ